MDTATKELLHYMQVIQGHSKKSALAILKGLSPEGQTAYLLQLRAEHLKKRGLVRGAAAPSTAVDVLEARVKPNKVPYSLLLPPAMLDALKGLSERDGSPVSHHIRMAIKSYLSRNK